MEVSRGLAIRSFIWKWLERSSVQGFQFLITIILARLLLPSEFGMVALVMIFVNICQVIVDGGLNMALVQKQNADNIDFSTIFVIELLMSIVIYSGLYITAPYIASFYSQPQLVIVTRVIGLILFLNAVNSVQNAYVLRELLFQQMFICSLVSVIISGVFGVLMAYYGYGVWAIVIQLLIAQIIQMITMFKVIGWRPEMVFSFSRLKDLFNYGWKIFASGIIISVFVNIRKLFIGKLYSASSLAFFDRGEQFPNLIVSNIQISIQSVLFPVLAKEQNDALRAKQILRRSIKMNCFVMYPIIILLVVSAKPLILFLLTEKWLPVVPIMQILCLSYFFIPITIPNLEAIKALGYSGISLQLEIIKKTVDVVILVISVSYGLYAIAWGVVLYNFICVFINLFPTKKLLNYSIPEQIYDVLPTFAISIIMGIVVYWIQYLPLHIMLLLLLQYFLGAVTYILLCYLSKENCLLYLIEIIGHRSRFFESQNTNK